MLDPSIKGFPTGYDHHGISQSSMLYPEINTTKFNYSFQVQMGFQNNVKETQPLKTCNRKLF